MDKKADVRLSIKESRLWSKIRARGSAGRPDFWLALFLTALLFVPVVVEFDFYYDLNDDVLIKDILSGVYSSTPDGHTMQLLYPLGWLLSLLYRILSIPVFGVFLVACQYGSIFVIGYRTAKCCKSLRAKMLALIAEGIFWTAAFGSHLVFVQYTVTAGMLAGAAIFWVATAESVCGNGEVAECGEAAGAWNSARSFLKENLPALALYWLAFCLRPEMALLLLPLAGVAGLCRWAQESAVFTKENICRYLSVFGALLLGLAICLGIDALAYSTEEWSEFRRFFDARTQLYDYQKDFIDNYEENAEAYEALGVTQTQQKLLASYNFGADDTIDADLLEKLAEAAVERPEAGGYFRIGLREGIWRLVHQYWFSRPEPAQGGSSGNGILAALGSLSGDCLNLVMLFFEAVVFVLGFFRKRRKLLWQAPLCIAAGGVLWMYLILRDRVVDRVSDPLYLGMILALAGLLLSEVRKDGKAANRQPEAAQKANQAGLTDAAAGSNLAGRRGKAEDRRHAAAGAGQTAGALAAVMTAVLLAVPAFAAMRDVSIESADRAAVNRTNEAVLSYCAAHPHMLYLEDVYSTVYYSEKITVDRDKPFNYDLLGGWLVKSPLTKAKLSGFGYSSMGKAVRAGKNVSLLAETGADMQWLSDYFEEEGIAAKVVKTGSATEGVELYQVVAKSSGQTLEEP